MLNIICLSANLNSYFIKLCFCLILFTFSRMLSHCFPHRCESTEQFSLICILYIIMVHWILSTICMTPSSLKEPIFYHAFFLKISKRINHISEYQRVQETPWMTLQLHFTILVNLIWELTLIYSKQWSPLSVIMMIIQKKIQKIRKNCCILHEKVGMFFKQWDMTNGLSCVMHEMLWLQ